MPSLPVLRNTTVGSRAARLLAILLLGGSLLVSGNSDRARCEGAVRQREWREAKRACLESGPTNPVEAALLAKAEMHLGEDDAALALVERAIEGPLRAEAREVKGILLDSRGDIGPARELLQSALDELRARGDRREAASAAYALAGSYFRSSQYRESLELLDSCQEEARSIQDDRLMGYVSLMRADVLRMVGDAAAAERAYDHARSALQEEAGDMAYVSLKQGILHRDASRLGLARAAFTDAIAKGEESGRRDVVDAGYIDLAWVAHLEKNPQEGMNFVDRYGGARDFSYFFTRAALELDLQRPTDALASIDAASSAANGDQSSWQAALAKGRILEATGDAAGAQACFARAVTIVERMRASFDMSELQSWMIAKRREPYEAMFVSLVKQGQEGAALAFLESFTARDFADALLADGQRDVGGVARREALADLVRKIVPGATSMGGVDGGLRGREVVIDVEANGRLWVIHCSPLGEVTFMDRGDAAHVSGLSRRFAADLDNDELADELGKVLLPDLSGTSGTPVYIVPTGSMVGVPYAALRYHEKFLIEERDVVVAPSLGILLRNEMRTPSVESLVLADPDGTLPAAEAEALDVGEIIAVEPRIGASATSSELRSRGSLGLLHLGVHSGVEDGEAWIRLADARWTAGDILDSGLHAELVVLASCASATTRHDEIWGSLAAAFLANGSGNVLATLGSVDDEDAKELVTEAYRHGLAADPVNALAEAQRVVVHKLQPHQWAPFVIYSGE